MKYQTCFSIFFTSLHTRLPFKHQPLYQLHIDTVTVAVVVKNICVVVCVKKLIVWHFKWEAITITSNFAHLFNGMMWVYS